MESSLLKLTKDVYFNRTGVLLLIAIAISGALIYFAVKSTGVEKEVLIAISTSLVASTVFAFLQTMLTGLRYEALVAQSISDSIESATRRVLEQTSSLQREFVPSVVYAASAIPDPKFNRDLTNDLRSTERYFFRGVTGRYAVARLHLADTVFDEVHILVAHPLDRRSTDARVTHIASYVETNTNYQDIQTRLTDEIFETIVGARLASVKCRRLTLHFLKEPQVDRVELFDTALYLTLYSDAAERGAKFPRTLRFGMASSLYKIYSSQLFRLRDSAENSVVIRPSTTDDELLAAIALLGGAGSAADLNSYESRFITFAKQLASYVA